MLCVASLNVRTLKDDERIVELQSALDKTDIDIILGMAEIRREGNRMIELNEWLMLCYTGNKEGQRGVGFLIKKAWSEKLMEYKGISDRIVMAKFKMKNDGSQTITIVQIYAPTSSAEEKEVEEFYETTIHSNLLKKINEYINDLGVGITEFSS